MSLYSNDALTLHTTAMGSAVVLGGISDAGMSLNTQTVTPDTGEAFDTAVSIQSQSPQIDFSTEAISSALTAVPGITGLCIDSDGTHPGVKLHAQKHDKCATAARTAAATTEHLSYTISNGLLLPQSLSVSGQGKPVLQMRAYGISTDGTTTPISTDYAVARPSSVITGEMFAMGVPYVDGTKLTQVTGINISWDYELEMKPYAGSLFPNIISVKKVKTSTTISSEDPTFMGAGANQIAQLGEVGNSVTSLLQFIKRDSSGGGYVADATTEHLICRVNGLIHITDPYKASGTGIATVDIKIDGLYNASSGSGVYPLNWAVGDYTR